jgi:hypothetical protein
MVSDSDHIIKYNPKIIRDIFKHKEEFHQSQAGLPIEEKIRILVELQKVALTIRPRLDENDYRAVWQLQ